MPNDFLDQLKLIAQLQHQDRLQKTRMAQEMFFNNNINPYQQAQLNHQKTSEDLQNRQFGLDLEKFQTAKLNNSEDRSRQQVNDAESRQLKLMGILGGDYEPAQGINFTPATPGANGQPFMIGGVPLSRKPEESVDVPSEWQPFLGTSLKRTKENMPIFTHFMESKLKSDQQKANSSMLEGLAGGVEKLVSELPEKERAGWVSRINIAKVSDKAMNNTQELQQVQKDLIGRLDSDRQQTNDVNKAVRIHNSIQDNDGVDLTPEATSSLAKMFVTTGQIPNVGSGKLGATNRTKIVNEAVKQFSNIDWGSQKASYQANQSALTRMVGQTEQIKAFEQTSLANLDRFLGVAKKVSDLDTSILNKPLRAIQLATGNKDLAAFNTARQVASIEVAKVLSGNMGNSVLSDTARQEVQGLLKGDYTLKQLFSAADILKQDMSSRIQFLNEGIKGIQDKIKLDTSPTNLVGPNKFDEEAAAILKRLNESLSKKKN